MQERRQLREELRDWCRYCFPRRSACSLRRGRLLGLLSRLGLGRLLRLLGRLRLLGALRGRSGFGRGGRRGWLRGLDKVHRLRIYVLHWC